MINRTQAYIGFSHIYKIICDRILSGEYRPDDRIPSVREMAIAMEVAPNTVVRAYERLLFSDILYSKRGSGYYISPEAPELVRQSRANKFLSEDLKAFVSSAHLLAISKEKLMELISSAFDEHVAGK